MKRFLLLSGLLLAGLAACAGRLDAPAAARPCALADLEPGDIAAVEPLWVPNTLIRSPAYTLGGVIVALRDADATTRARAEAQVARCASTCGDLPGPVHASLGGHDGRLEVVLRADDPVTARAVLASAERRQAGR